MEEKEEKLVSSCCQTEMIPPDYELAESMGSLYRAHLAYICKKCKKACEPKKISEQLMLALD